MKRCGATERSQFIHSPILGALNNFAFPAHIRQKQKIQLWNIIHRAAVSTLVEAGVTKGEGGSGVAGRGVLGSKKRVRANLRSVKMFES